VTPDSGNPLNLRRELRIGTNRALEKGEQTPDWASFMTVLGWWLSGIEIEEGTLHCAVVLPRRECCSALAAFGSQIASAQQHFDHVDWEGFLGLRRGTTVHLQMLRGKKMTPYRAELLNEAGEVPRVIKLEGESLKIEVRDRNFSHYQFRMTPYLTGRQWRISKGSKIYTDLIDGVDPQWGLSEARTTVLVTVMARWERENAGVRVGAAKSGSTSPDESHALRDVLMCGSQGQTPGVKTVLHPPGGSSPEGGPFHLAIIDGPAALSTLPWIDARTALILLSQAELDEQVWDQIVDLTCRRDDALARNLPPLPVPLAGGVDLIVFVNPGQHR